MLKRIGLCAAGAVLAASAPAMAVVSFDQNVTPDVIFGSGNANGSFTVDRSNGIELGLRGKLRFDSNNQPQNTFNSNGAGVYSFQPGTPPIGFGFAANSPTTPVWSFEWSVNTDFDGTSGLFLDDLTYELGMDFDPSIATNFQTFDPIIPGPADHALGDNSTPNGGGTVDIPNYGANIGVFNVAQNSWNYEFFNDAPWNIFDPNDTGTYDIFLRAIDASGNEVSRVDIQINIIPEPVTAGLGFLAMGALGMSATRRRR